MISTLDKVKLLERYIAADNSVVDPVIDLTIDKLLSREIKRMLQLNARLTGQLKKFEKKYALNSNKFYRRYEKGEMGDEINFVEWAATVEMQANANKRLELLEKDL